MVILIVMTMTMIVTTTTMTPYRKFNQADQYTHDGYECGDIMMMMVIVTMVRMMMTIIPLQEVQPS